MALGWLRNRRRLHHLRYRRWPTVPACRAIAADTSATAPDLTAAADAAATAAGSAEHVGHYERQRILPALE